MSQMPCSLEIRGKSEFAVERRAGLRSPGESELYRAKRSAEAASLAKTEYLSVLCHEIRNPVSVMLGMMDLALQTNLTHEQREYLTLMKISSGSILSVINNTLDIEKIEAGFIELESLRFSLRNSLGETVKMLSFEAQRKGLHLAFTVAPDVPDMVRGDPMRLRQIVLNLLSNAIKFTDHGQVIMQVTRQKLSDSELTCCFAISDTGPGIALNRQAAIFAPFVQADKSVARQYGGSGLGLSIVSRLVRLMSGNLWLESLPGNGSTFFFTVCLGLPNEQSDVYHSMPISSPLDSLPGNDVVQQYGTRSANCLRILLVDDDPLNLRLAQLVLEKEGCNVTLAMSAENAFDALQRERFDVVLMDMKMPGMDGCQATRELRLREKSNGGERMLIFALSANESLHDQQYCLESGMDGFLKKPIKPGDLFALIRRLQVNSVTKSQPLVLDERALIDSVGGDKKLLVEIIDLFLEHSDKLMKSASQSISAGNQSQFELVTHTLKGMFQCLFANSAGCVARNLQDMVTQDQRVELFSQLENEVAMLKVVLIRLKPKASPPRRTGKLQQYFALQASHRVKNTAFRSTGGH